MEAPERIQERAASHAAGQTLQRSYTGSQDSGAQIAPHVRRGMRASGWDEIDRPAG